MQAQAASKKRLRAEFTDVTIHGILCQMTIEGNPALKSVVVAIDGEAKCGKTTLIDGIAEETLYQSSIIPGIISDDTTVAAFGLTENHINNLQSLRSHMTFNSVTKISAGNMFRAVALYWSLLELGGDTKTHFVESDADDIRSLLLVPDIQDTLQTDPNVATLVSTTSKMIGVQALCGAIFSDSIVKAYNEGDGGNLVIVDARDPIGHIQRNGALGSQIHPASVIPIYVDTPTEMAATRMKGDFETNLRRLAQRRHDDATRKELPVVVPDDLQDDLNEWLATIITGTMLTRDTPIHPFRLQNGERVSLSSIQYFSGQIAEAAQELGHYLFHFSEPEAQCWDPSPKSYDLC